VDATGKPTDIVVKSAADFTVGTARFGRGEAVAIPSGRSERRGGADEKVELTGAHPRTNVTSDRVVLN